MYTRIARRRIVAIVTVSVSVLVTGCASNRYGRPVDFDLLRQFRPDQSFTKEDVTARMGAPMHQCEEKDNLQSWLYQYIESGAALGLQATLHQRSKSAIFVFREDKLIELIWEVNVTQSKGYYLGGGEAGKPMSQDEVNSIRASGATPEQLVAQWGEPYSHQFKWDGTEAMTYVHVKTNRPTTVVSFRFEQGRLISADWSVRPAMTD